jgi:hypothetical protein
MLHPGKNEPYVWNRAEPRMQFEFDEKIDSSIEKSVKAALRFYKEQQNQAQENHAQQDLPSYEDFASLVERIMESNKRADMNKLRTPSLRELFERAWSQNLRNYATQRRFLDAYEALMRHYRRQA